MLVKVKTIKPYSRQSHTPEEGHKEEQMFVVEFEGEDPTDYVSTKDVTPEEVSQFVVGAEFIVTITNRELMPTAAEPEPEIS